MTPAEARSILGEPLRHEAGNGRVTWKYESLYRLRACRLYFLFIPLGPAAKERRTVTLVFRDDQLLTATLVTRGGFGRQGTQRLF